MNNSPELDAKLKACDPEIQQYVIELKAENAKLQKRIVRLEAQNVSSHNRILALEDYLKKHAHDYLSELTDEELTSGIEDLLKET